jgi:hypothetical protein
MKMIVEEEFVAKGKIICDLGEGLILRSSAVEDAGPLADFNSRIHSEYENEKEVRVGVWTQDLLTKPHPTFQVSDFTVVEDTHTGEIVSSMNLISQTWSYRGIQFKVGRPELVGTDPAYRGRGLVRAQFEVIHQWSAERGEAIQAITGIPYYYRQFGYEMCLNLEGGRAGYLPHIPKLAEGKTEPFLLRPATEADLPFLMELYDLGCQRSLISCIWDEAMWRYELFEKSPDNVNRYDFRLIETPQGEPVGFLGYTPFRWGSMLAARLYELKPGVSWTEVTPSVVRYMQKVGETLPPYHGDTPFNSFGFWMGEEHPVYHVIENSLPRIRKPYAWYIRIPDLPGFLRQISPILEERLAASLLVGYSGELKISFYRDGLKLSWDKGRLVNAETWKPFPQGHSGQAAFPGLTFLQLLVGYRSLREMKHAFVDCWTDNDEVQAFLEAIFPQQPSAVWPVA